ncbi:MAG TPA: hypothetical protein ENK18_21305 [Deltaproteobacteria bacterium]|nr:hypothetical protein [Deltaproteobacteria bacterium]
MSRLAVFVVSLSVAVSAVTPHLASAADPADHSSVIDEAGGRVAFHYADGTVAVYHRGHERPIVTIQGPQRIDRLLLSGDTLVASGPDGVWIWRAGTGELIQRLIPSDPLVLSEDGRHLATGSLLFEVGILQPIAAWPAASAVAFSDDGARVATLHGDHAVLREVPEPIEVR